MENYKLNPSQQARDIDPVLTENWPSIYDDSPTLSQYCAKDFFLGGGDVKSVLDVGL